MDKYIEKKLNLDINIGAGIDPCIGKLVSKGALQVKYVTGAQSELAVGTAQEKSKRGLG
jgi:hypothetical protein